MNRGWKRYMTAYDHEWVTEIINENNKRGFALREIAETARWYANNSARLPLEVDHALCVEILSLAENSLERA